jgi:hypothetical protein
VEGDVVLKLGLDVRQAQAAAEGLQRSLSGIGSSATSAAVAMDAAGQSASEMSEASDGAGSSFATLVVEADKTQKALFSVDGIVAQLANKFARLGKAAVGIFAIDVATKVFGFSSAMDLLNKASQAVANTLRDGLGISEIARRMEEEKKRVEDAAAAWDKLAKARANAEQQLYPNRYDLPLRAQGVEIGPSLATGLKRYLLGNLPSRNTSVDLSDLSLDSQKLAVEMLQGLRARWEGVTDQMKAVWDQEGSFFFVDYEKRLQEFLESFDESLNSVQAKITEMREADRITKLDVRGGGGDFDEARYRQLLWNAGRRRELMYGEESGPPLPPGYDPEPQVYGGDSGTFNKWNFWRDPQRPAMDAAASMFGPYARMGAYAAYSAGSVAYDRRDESVLSSLADLTRRATESKYGMKPADSTFWEKRDEALDMRYSTEVLATDFSSNFYEQFKYSLMSADFSDFGRTTVQMLQSSLIDALIAQPFQQAMDQVVRMLLGALTGIGSSLAGSVGAGSGTSSSTATSGGVAKPMMSGSGSGSGIAGARSTRQRFDDGERRRVRL